MNGNSFSLSSVSLTIVRCLFVLAALVAAYYSALFARASFLFHQETLPSALEAVKLVPYNGAYVARLSSWQPDRKIALLHRAVELNPFDVDSWIQLGLIAEMEQHDIPSAESYYLQAWQVDRMFLPRWTLTNFYFRRQASAKFFHWAEATLEITPYPADPVFTQMWLMSQDPGQIAAYLPNRAGILLQYASFLANTHQFGAVAPIVRRLVAAVGARNPVDYGRDDQIGPTEDRLLAAGDLSAALDIWRSMKQGNWVELPAPSRAHPLNNGDFQVPFFRHGFDWTPIPPIGVVVDQFPAEKSVRITFSGTQPEHCVLLQQYVPLDPSRSYHLHWQAESREIQSPSGLAWHLSPIPNKKQAAPAATDLLNSSEQMWDFTPPANASLYLLTLEYTRPLGSVRATGDVTLRRVSLEQR